jgi:hypothetical protein
MAATKKEIQEWLDYFDDDDLFGVDEGGLALRSVDNPRAYFEIGGIPEEEEEPGWPYK